MQKLGAFGECLSEHKCIYSLHKVKSLHYNRWDYINKYYTVYTAI